LRLQVVITAALLVTVGVGVGPYRRHLLETDVVIVVWAVAAPDDTECAAERRTVETFDVRAPIGDRPVIDQWGVPLLPER
jgi:hypothetical protein